MKIARFQAPDGTISYGIAEDNGDMRQAGGDPFKGLTPSGGVIKSYRLLPPVDPPNIFAIGLNYHDHAAETGKQVPDHPLIFIKATSSLVGSGEPIVLPASAPNEVDYEAELAVIISHTARKVSADDADRYILGYTCANDVSARDCQMRLDGQWARAKSFDTFCPLGPYLVTDIDAAGLGVRSRLNGEIMQQSSTDQMAFGVRELISYLSHQFTLLPGTVVLTGTPAGVGVGRTPQRFLRENDTIEIEIDGIGTLRNAVEGPLP